MTPIRVFNLSCGTTFSSYVFNSIATERKSVPQRPISASTCELQIHCVWLMVNIEGFGLQRKTGNEKYKRQLLFFLVMHGAYPCVACGYGILK